MPLDIEPELEAEGAVAWSVQENIVIGAHRPPQASPGEEWEDVERHYCFGVSDTPCEVEVEGEGRIVAGPDIVRFHSVGDRIRTTILPEAGSASTWVLLSGNLIEAIFEESGGCGEVGTSARPFPRSFVQPALPDLADLRVFLRQVERGACGMWIEEAIASLLPRLLSGTAKKGNRRLQAPTPRQRALALEADELLTHNYAGAISLSDVAAMLGVTAPHLARSYRAATGSRLHTRLTSLRLAAAMERLAEGAPDLTYLGLDLGFANHSHFTAAFRHWVGMAPSTFRTLCAAGSNIR